MSDRNHVLAMYDVRGKQDYIFRTNKLKEIVGASWIIRDVFFDCLKPAAERIAGGGKGICSYRWETDALPFSEEGFKKHLEQGYIGEVVYDGGGNFILLFKDEDTFRSVTYEFTKDVMIKTGTLRVLGTCVPIDDFSDYEADRRRLYAAHRVHEARESKIDPWSCLPIVQVDRGTSMPIVEKTKEGDSTRESKAKIDKYADAAGRMKSDQNDAARLFYASETVLDDLVDEKGVDSQLAVVYIDGNNMGAKVQSILNGLSSYEDCVAKLRSFSEEIQARYVENGIRQALNAKTGKHRIVVYAGDEVNFVVKASDAFACARAYLEGLDRERDESACAGIAVFHSHAPYADAYRIAEEACESGKQAMKKQGMECASLIDFHICQGSIDLSLEKIREEENGGIISRPWLVCAGENEKEKAKGLYDIGEVDRLCAFLRVLGRSNVKGLATAAFRSKTDLSLELKRICAHMKEEKKKAVKDDLEWLGLSDKGGSRLKERFRNLIYDVVIAYDLWFDDSRKKEGETAE